MEKNLVSAVVERLRAKERQAIDRAVSEAVQSEEQTAEKSRIETQLAIVGLEVRESMVWHWQNMRKSRLGRWLGGRTVQMTYGQDPDFHDIFSKIIDLRKVPMSSSARNIKRKYLAEDFQNTLSTPLLFTEPGDLVDQHRFEYGWRFTLKTGSHAPGKPKYNFNRSPLYMYRVAREINTGEEASELKYTMFFDGCMDGRRGNELESYTNGSPDDEIAMVGSDAHMHALGMMQAALEELWH